MLETKVIELLNHQVKFEFYSAYLYLAFADYYEYEGLTGFANWFFVQAQEERDHALLMRQYLLNEGQKITLEVIEAAVPTIKDFKEPLTLAYAHELDITKKIHTIYAEASKDNDYRTMQFLDWFVKEQAEEEKSVDDLIKKYELFGSDAKGLYLMDAEMKTRVYAAPSLILT